MGPCTVKEYSALAAAGRGHRIPPALPAGRAGGHGRWRAVRKTLAVLVAAGSVLLGIAMATPALASTDTLVCSPSANGGALVNGVCVLPGASVGQPYEGFIITSNNSGG